MINPSMRSEPLCMHNILNGAAGSSTEGCSAVWMFEHNDIRKQTGLPGIPYREVLGRIHSCPVWLEPNQNNLWCQTFRAGVNTDQDQLNQCSPLDLHYCCTGLTPPHTFWSNGWTFFVHMWVCWQILGLFWKLQCEKEPHQTKKLTLYFGRDQGEQTEGLPGVNTPVATDRAEQRGNHAGHEAWYVYVWWFRSFINCFS